jgi:hypothetical protein
MHIEFDNVLSDHFSLLLPYSITAFFFNATHIRSKLYHNQYVKWGINVRYSIEFTAILTLPLFANYIALILHQKQLTTPQAKKTHTKIECLQSKP